MKRHELEHLIRAAAAITDRYEIVVIGSQAILGSFPDAPPELLVSREADLYPLQSPERANLIDGAIGELSAFDEAYGYYAQGVGPDTALLPAQWEARLVKLQNANTDLKIGYCLDPTDLAASKLAAGRDKDWPFVAAMLEHALIDADTLKDRLRMLPLPESRIARLSRWVSGRDAGMGGESD